MSRKKWPMPPCVHSEGDSFPKIPTVLIYVYTYHLVSGKFREEISLITRKGGVLVNNFAVCSVCSSSAYFGK